jgi:hypothetical protein
VNVALLVGTLMPIVVGLFATIVGLDRDRAFYPTLMIVIAVLYALFAVMGGSTQALLLELLAGTAFVVAAVWGFKGSLWVVAVALALHGVFDFEHGWLIDNPGVPAWWPAFCGTYDVVAAGYLAGLLTTGRVGVRAPGVS